LLWSQARALEIDRSIPKWVDGERIMARKYILGLLTIGATIALGGAVPVALSSPALALQTSFINERYDELYADDPANCDLAEPSDEPLAAGKVVAVDRADGKITLEYRPIPQVFLEGGTRVFQVEDPAMLKGRSAGDKVRFEVELEGGHNYIVTRIENSN
jgi:Cu/Ag efflux protein CusF